MALSRLRVDLLAEGLLEAHQRCLLCIIVVVVAEQNGGHRGEAGVESLRQLSVRLEQGASVGAVCAFLNVLPVLDLVLKAAAFGLEGLIGEGAHHNAMDEIDCLGLLRLS